MLINAESYLKIRKYSDYLCSFLELEDYGVQACDYVSPPKWHLAHATWFFESIILHEFDESYEDFNADFNYIFNSYYEQLGERNPRAQRGFLSRPTIKEVMQYRSSIDRAMCELLNSNSSIDLLKLVEIGLYHEQQHQEILLADIKYILHLNPGQPVYCTDGQLIEEENIETGFCEVQEGLYQIGHDGSGFCFDNEMNKHQVYLNAFQISKELVTNQAYLEFMDSGGYQKPELWLSDGWDWLKETGIESPLYWKKQGGEWFVFTLGGLRPLRNESILCHISFYEAHAFAKWSGHRLPTEYEWEAAASLFSWGKRYEWTNSAYLPYPGFKELPGAIGEYDGKFMINQMVLRGASVATTHEHNRDTFRNFFPADMRWQFTGIRLIK